jgi:hypothetical protein
MKRVREIAKLVHNGTGEVIYLPMGQDFPDSAESLEMNGLIRCEYENGQWVGTFVPDPDNIRVLAWQLTLNARCRRAGQPEMFKGLPIDVVDAEPTAASQ